MESEVAATEIERVRRAFMGRIARALLPEGGGIDRRDALALIDCDVIRAESSVDAEDSINGLRQAVVLSAAKASLGPLLFYIKDSGSRSVVRVRDLLLDGRPKIRAIAVAHLENTFALPGLSTRRTRQELERLRPALLASDGSGWRRAAIDLVDAVDEDWLLGIAGVRQAQNPALQEVWSEYVTMVLRPSLASVNACWPPILCAGLHAESMDQQAKAWQAEGGSSVALYAAYLEAVGHLPLGGSRSLSGVLSMINGGAPSEAVGAELLDWATNDGSPFARYHACEAVMSGWAGLATRDHSRAAVWFWETVLAPRGCVGAKGGCAAESLAAQLARYYLHYLEVRLPSDHGEAIAAMAWWMAMANDRAVKRLRDFTAATVERWLRDQADKGMSAGTRNGYRQACVTFVNWCVRAGRLTHNPLLAVAVADQRADTRRQRRALTEEELARLLDAAQRRPLADAMTVRRGEAKGQAQAKVTPATRENLLRIGRERALIYKTLVLTGLRKGELASITVGQVDLGGRVPHLLLNARDEKNRRGSEIPLRTDLAADIRAWLADRLAWAQQAARDAEEPIPAALPSDEALFDVPDGLIRIFDRDLVFAGLARIEKRGGKEVVVKTDDRGRTIDIHALRHTFGTHLSKAGVPLRTAQAAMRHSDPSLTANVYTDPKLLDVAGAVASLPDLPLGGVGGHAAAVQSL